MKNKLRGRSLVIVPCSKSKIWEKYPDIGKVPAKDAYISSNFKKCREYAESYCYDWVILSAKYGFIKPNFNIPENYNVTFNRKSKEVVSNQKLRQQARRLGNNYDNLVILGGKQYEKATELAFRGLGLNLYFPLHRLKTGQRLKKLNEYLVYCSPLRS